jgi:hypothetical protein
VGIVQHAPANSQDHGSVSAHQRFKGDLFPVSQITFQQLAIGQFRDILEQDRPAEMLNQTVNVTCHHRWPSGGFFSYMFSWQALRADFFLNFFNDGIIVKIIFLHSLSESRSNLR